MNTTGNVSAARTWTFPARSTAAYVQRLIQRGSAFEQVVFLASLLMLLWALWTWQVSAFVHFLGYFSLIGMTAVAMSLVVRAGGVDLSVAGVVSVAMAAVMWGAQLGFACTPVLGLLAGVLVGVMNGLVVSFSRFPSALVTFASGGAVSATIFIYRKGDAAFTTNTSALAWTQHPAASAGIPLLSLMVLTAVVWFVLNRTGYARLFDAYARGRSEYLDDTERLQVQLLSYGFSGLAGGVAGTVLMWRGFEPKFIVQSGWHLFPLAAALAGGGVLSQRKCSMRAALLGALFLSLLTFRMHNLHFAHLTLFVAVLAILVCSFIDGWKQSTWQEVSVELEVNRAKSISLVAVVAAITLGGWLLVDRTMGQAPPGTALLLRAEGDVRVRRKDSEKWIEGQSGMILERSDELTTSPNAIALMVTARGDVMKIDPGTHLKLERLQEAEAGTVVTRIWVPLGRVWMKVEELMTGEAFEVDTPSAVASVRGTYFVVASSQNKTYTSVYEGIMQVQAAEKVVLVKSGQETSVLFGRAPRPPREMSPEEQAAWARERPVLQQPDKEEFWQAVQQSNWLEDSFNSPHVNARLWFLRSDDPKVVINQQNGSLVIGGEASSKKELTHGILSIIFPKASLHASTLFMLPKGQGQVRFHLADQSGSENAVGLVYDPSQGYSIARGGTLLSEVLRPFGTEALRFHRLTLSYDAGAAMLSAYVDERLVGTVEAQLGEWLHFELLYQTPGAPDAFECQFDDFLSNVPVGEGMLADTVVALVTRPGKQDASTLLALLPLFDPQKLQQVRATYPSPVQPSSPIYARRTEEGNLAFSTKFKAWSLKADGQPISGEYIFHFQADGKKMKAKPHPYDQKQILPPVPSLRDGRDANSILLEWDPMHEAGVFWVEVVNADTHEPLFTSMPIYTNGANIQNPGLAAGQKYVVAVFARRGSVPAEGANVPRWAQYCRPILEHLEPTEAASISVQSAQGREEFSVQLSPLRTW